MFLEDGADRIEWFALSKAWIETKSLLNFSYCCRLATLVT